jgi:broad specificity phosphatase PhoE
MQSNQNFSESFASPGAGALPHIKSEHHLILSGIRTHGFLLTPEDVALRRKIISELEARREALLKHVRQYETLSSNDLAELSSDSPMKRDHTDDFAQPNNVVDSPSIVSAKKPEKGSIFALIRAGLVTKLLNGLVKGTFSVHEVDDNGSTPLHVAAFEGRVDMIRVLLTFSPDRLAKDASGNTPADLALRCKHAAAFRLLAPGTVISAPMLPSGGGSMSRSSEGSAGSSVESEEGEGMRKAAVGVSEGGMSRRYEDDELLVQGDSGDSKTPPVSDAGGVPGVGTGTTDSECQPPTAGHSFASGSLNTTQRKVRTSRFCTISDSQSLVLFMVGLPGRGKSFISKRICRYLNWKGVPSRVFNAGDYRRNLLGVTNTRGAAFFDANDPVAAAQREKMAELACEDLQRFIDENDVAVGILDATNTTVSRRRKVVDYFQSRNPNLRVMFIESVCDDQEMIRENILRAKCGGADYQGVSDLNAVVKDFEDRIQNYAKVYEPLCISEGHPFIKLCNVKEQVVIHKIRGGIPSKITYFLLNLYHLAFPVYLTMPGETMWQRIGSFGGDESLTEEGKRYSRKLATFIKDRLSTDVALTILYGTTGCCQQTVKIIQQVLSGAAEETEGSANVTTPSSVHEIESSLKDYTGSPSFHIPTRGRNQGADFGSAAWVRSEDSDQPQDLRVRFAAMRALDGINYGLFVGLRPKEAQDRWPKLFSKLFGEGEKSVSGHAPGPIPRVAAACPIPLSQTEGEADERSVEATSPSTPSFPIPNNATSGSTRGLAGSRASAYVPHYHMTFPRGESCRQVNVRLERAIMEIMRIDGPVLIIAPLNPIQGLAAFLSEGRPENSPNFDFALHTVQEHGGGSGKQKEPITHRIM